MPMEAGPRKAAKGVTMRGTRKAPILSNQAVRADVPYSEAHFPQNGASQKPSTKKNPETRVRPRREKRQTSLKENSHGSSLA